MWQLIKDYVGGKETFITTSQQISSHKDWSRIIFCNTLKCQKRGGEIYSCIFNMELFVSLNNVYDLLTDFGSVNSIVVHNYKLIKIDRKKTFNGPVLVLLMKKM